MEMRTYEGMFLLNPTQVTQEWDKMKNVITGMVEKRGGTIVSAKKWGERKLAYEIKGHKRGTYALVYFQMPPQSIVTLRRDFLLSESVLRSLILVHTKPFKIPEIPDNPAEGEIQGENVAGQAQSPSKEQESPSNNS
jgi:small subunit ribosomal protein S6